MSMRAVERFIKEQMNGDSKKALDLLEATVGKKLKIKSAGRPKIDPKEANFWYLYLWGRLEHKKKAKKNKIITEKISLDKELDLVIPLARYVNMKIIPCHDGYYVWLRTNQKFLNSNKDSPALKNKLELIYEYVYEIMAEFDPPPTYSSTQIKINK